jgi:hypothetical protein
LAAEAVLRPAVAEAVEHRAAVVVAVGHGAEAVAAVATGISRSVLRQEAACAHGSVR